MYLKTLAFSCLAAVLSACGTLAPPDTEYLQHEFAERQPALALPEPDSRMQEHAGGDLPPGSLNPAQAQQIALTHSPDIRRMMARLGVADAERQQTRMRSNPAISVGTMRPEGGGRWKAEFGITQNLLDWFTLPLRETLSEAAYIEAQAELLDELTTELHLVLKDYYGAVAAQQRYLVQVDLGNAADLNAELAQLMRDAGNISELDMLRYSSQAQQQHIRLSAAHVAAKKALYQLNVRLGLNPSTPLELPRNLPAPAMESLQAEQLIQQAMQNRPDLQLARKRQALIQSQLDLEQRHRGFLQVDAGIDVEREFSGEVNAGPSLTLSLPLFDQGQARTASWRSQALLADAMSDALTLQAQQEIHNQLAEIQHAQQQYRLLVEQLLPAQERMLTLSVQEYNFMLTGPFDLLQMKEQELEVRLLETELLEQYWHARSALALAVGGSELPVAPSTEHPETTPRPASPPEQPESEPMEEHHHD